MPVANAAPAAKTVADPNAAYESTRVLWDRSRAVCSGERFVKDYDSFLDTQSFTNLLIPFSPSMTPQQYKFYKAEAELPGIVAQFAKMLVGGLLRKQPVIELPEDAPEDAMNWIMEEFSQDDSPMASFLDVALWEEMQTSRAWVYVDYPSIEDAEQYTRAELAALKPYPILWSAESVINWKVGTNNAGKTQLERVIVKGFSEEFTEDNEFHPSLVSTVWVHELDKSGNYQIRVYKQRAAETAVDVVNGKTQIPTGTTASTYELNDTITDILINNERLTIVPAWPLNGSIDVVEPMLSPVIDREISLYNKISRRNHLLYGAATYTPVIASDMMDEEFEDIVASGLGTWIKLKQGDTATILDTPTAALVDMDRAIASTIEEMAKMGIRMLTPETAQSGVALELRNAAQTAQLGTLNTKISNTLTSIICFMMNWRYDTEYKPADIKFSLSADFNPVPLGADWLRLATEWYQSSLIPREIWLQILKQNDMIPPDYDDEEGLKQINDDELLIKAVNDNYAAKLANDPSMQMKGNLNG